MTTVNTRFVAMTAASLALLGAGCVHASGKPATVRVLIESVAIDGSPRPGAVVAIDGKDAGTTPVEVRLVPGQHEVVVEIGEDFTKEIIEIGTRDVRVKLAPYRWKPPELGAPDEPTLDRQHIAERISSDATLINQCYRLLRVRRARAAGKLVVRFQVHEDGSVGWAWTPISELVDAETEECVAARFRRLSFDKPVGGGTMTVNFPIEFHQHRRRWFGKR